jgi:hypothetical protein
MDAPRVADTSEVDGDGMASEVLCCILECSHHMVVAVASELRVWVGNHDDGAGWILLSTDNIGLNRDAVKGF